jgi:hypothetical protein
VPNTPNTERKPAPKVNAKLMEAERELQEKMEKEKAQRITQAAIDMLETVSRTKQPLPEKFYEYYNEKAGVDDGMEYALQRSGMTMDAIKGMPASMLLLLNCLDDSMFEYGSFELDKEGALFWGDLLKLDITGMLKDIDKEHKKALKELQKLMEKEEEQSKSKSEPDEKPTGKARSSKLKKDEMKIS